MLLVELGCGLAEGQGWLCSSAHLPAHTAPSGSWGSHPERNATQQSPDRLAFSSGSLLIQPHSKASGVEVQAQGTKLSLPEAAALAWLPSASCPCSATFHLATAPAFPSPPLNRADANSALFLEQFLGGKGWERGRRPKQLAFSCAQIAMELC